MTDQLSQREYGLCMFIYPRAVNMTEMGNSRSRSPASVANSTMQQIQFVIAIAPVSRPVFRK
jgi:hypothetical protein